MNYMKELNAFRNWVMLNRLSTGQIALWHTLMSINNMSGWQESFTAPNQTLQLLTGLSRQGLDGARNGLIQSGRIRYRKGKSNQAGTYQMISLLSLESESECQIIGTGVDEVVDKGVDTEAAQVLTQERRGGSTLFKQRRKPKQDEELYAQVFEQFWSIYPRRVGKKRAYAQWQRRLKSSSYSELMMATQNYAQECERLGTEPNFIKHPSTFLSDKLDYQDYLDPPEQQKTEKPEERRARLEREKRDREVAFNRWMADGGDPDDFVYPPNAEP
ncbi:hypothetical protein [Marininema halotolerans]|uniref:Helix-turn-helix domain-containing protein n=1 Tax=Marininema halotolerans TaxID=1155944 RepID=A0A1I6UQJ2_9BACL|nr:hypothetical protein [Marininema halotolerans]SFT03711.1 hypothetical protein SAMN05444972_1198 [Marininema halotolerans]